MKENKEELERVCFNCNQFFPASMNEATEFGMCLMDEVFEPYIEELLENSNFASCQDLIDCKKFPGEREACENFEESESIEIDDESPLGREINHLRKTGNLNIETLREALLKEEIRNIDWKTMPVARYVRQLESPKKEEQEKGISSLGGMIAFGNKEAFKELFEYFKKLPPPKTLDEVYFKKKILRQLEHHKTMSPLVPQLIDELYNTPSNNTTRQWITDIFRFLRHSPIEEVRAPLEKMVNDNRFSYRIKRKIKDILYQEM
jgi:hypothetical protein